MEQDDDENEDIEQEASLITGKELGTLKNIEQKLISLAEGTNVFVTYLHKYRFAFLQPRMLFGSANVQLHKKENAREE